MKKRMITRVLALAFVIGGISLPKAKANPFPSTLIHCISQMLWCEEFCYIAYSQEPDLLAGCFIQCQLEFDSCLGR